MLCSLENNDCRENTTNFCCRFGQQAAEEMYNIEVAPEESSFDIGAEELAVSHLLGMAEPPQQRNRFYYKNRKQLWHGSYCQLRPSGFTTKTERMNRHWQHKGQKKKKKKRKTMIHNLYIYY